MQSHVLPASRRRASSPGASLRTAFLSASLAVSLLGPASALAQDDESGPNPTVRDIPRITAQLESANPDEVIEAINLLFLVDNNRVVPPLAALLRSGREDRVTDAALFALAGLKRPSSLDVLTEFTNHRRVAARRAAYTAIAEIEDRRVPTLLERGLRDSDRGIRGLCARELGEIGAIGSVETLFLAFERGVVQAGQAIGKLAPASEVPRFHSFLANEAERRVGQPLSVMLAGYGEFLGRRDIPDETKINIVQTLAENPSDQVRRFLQRFFGSLPRRTVREQRRPLYIAARDAVNTVISSLQGGEGSEQ